ncbi:hypothetical protein F5Y01DRAFT_320622 [Xylaria sp. FL0043]|nr:hypothetical protein F5Y01DRAFT_320622 [Xylaria sp. FL0043]
MELTFLDYLTLANPNPTVQSRGGWSSKTRKVYGPDKQRPWKDITFENLQATFGTILSQAMDPPDVRNSGQISSEKTKVFTEKSVQKIAALWNEPVVQQALDGTHELLSETYPDVPFIEGKIQFIENDGRGNIVDEKGKQQKPDWMVYQVGQRGTTVDNLIPGDCKPAAKWKSEWLNGDSETLKKKAHWVLRQATKYMCLGNKRYSFILSEEELVPMRLSIYTRDLEVKSRRFFRSRESQVVTSSRMFEESDTEEDEGRLEAGSDISRISQANDPEGSFADASRNTGYILEWCSIPWSHEGADKLTVNLTFWWLSVLAIQSAALKEYGRYTPLGEKTRGHSPVFSGPPLRGYTEETDRRQKATAQTKRKIEEPEVESPMKRSRTTRGSIRHVTGTSSNPGLAGPSRQNLAESPLRSLQRRSTVQPGSRTRPSLRSRRSRAVSSIREKGRADDISSQATSENSEGPSQSFVHA